MNDDHKWAKRYFRLARHWADECSKDPTTKVGAVIVGCDPRQIALGYNGFPPGIEDVPARYNDRPTKYLFTQHAERNVLDNAHFSCEGGTLVTTMFPCVECTKSLIAKGIGRLVSPPMPEPLPNGEKSWRDDCKVSMIMLQEAGIQITWIVPGDGKPFSSDMNVVEQDGVYQLG